MLSFSGVLSLLFSCLVLSAYALPSAEKRGVTLAQVITKCTTPNTVALTFDDGPYDWILNISSTLAAAGAKGTFFFNGNNWRCIYSPQNGQHIKAIYSKGHQIASHTWAHRNLTTLTFDKIHDEMWRVEQAFQRLVGVTPAFVRPPYGAYNNLVRQVAAQRGQKLVLWDFDSKDTLGYTPAQTEQLFADVVKTHPSTLLPLMHEVINGTVFEVLPYAVNLFKKAGYKLVTLADCIGASPYQKVVTPPPLNSSWTC